VVHCLVLNFKVLCEMEWFVYSMQLLLSFYVASASTYHLFTIIASHLIPLFFRYDTVDFNSIRQWMCASFITNHLEVP